MATASWPLQQAVYDALTADSGVSGLVEGIHDHAPEDGPFPYVQLGEETLSDWSAKDITGGEHTLTLHVWSMGRGHREVKTIMAAVHDALHDASLTVSGHRLVMLHFDFGEVLRDPDGVTHHGVMRFRALAHETS